MAWDERRFGLEYDLDLYQIVTVGVQHGRDGKRRV